jgi:hypothetical protein
MENKLPEEFLFFFESILSAQLRVVRQFKNPKSGNIKLKKGQSMSNINMAIDILQKAKQPLHISEIINQVKTKHGLTLDRESLVSALVKKVHQNQGVIRSAPNTFHLSGK